MSEHMESSANFQTEALEVCISSDLDVHFVHFMGSLRYALVVKTQVFSLMFDLPELRLPTKKAAEARAWSHRTILSSEGAGPIQGNHHFDIV